MKTFTRSAAALAFLLFIAGAAIGWFMNIYIILTTFGDMALAEIVIRLFGVPVLVLGSVLGWVTF